jgi:hypothetical protein
VSFFKIFLIFLVVSPLWAEVKVETAWGTETIDHPILEKLLHHPVLCRMQRIDQSGPLFYFNAAPKFTRYDHSVGVLVLLLKAGAPLKEQIAGLFHDVSHTAFSHVADHLLFESNLEHSYQDRIHLEFLKKMGVEDAIKGLMSLEEMDPDRSDYRALERPHPNICADRLQYIVHTGVVFNKITKIQAHDIISSVKFTGRDWYFINKTVAKTFAMLSIDFTKELWGSPWNFIFYECFSRTLKRAIDMHLIQLEDIQYGTDENIMKILSKAKDPILQKQLEVLHAMRSHFMETPFGKGEGSWNIKPKCRAVDPLVNTSKGLVRLSTLDASFQQALDAVQKWCKKGYGVRLVDVDPTLFTPEKS